MKKVRICAVVLVLALIFPLVTNAININSDGACVIDAQTGEVYFEKSGNTYMTPASLTKVMTLFVIFEEMEKGNLTEETLIPISSNAAKLSVSGDASNIPLTAGKSLPLKTLLDAMVIVSACASCTAVAEYISGSEDNFAEYMNDVAAKYNLNAYFTDASGLSDYNLITPESMARLAKLFIEKYPQILDYTSKTSAYINGHSYSSTNKLLSPDRASYYYSGADGFKTGTTSKAGNCLVSTAQRDSLRVISVVFHAPSDSSRYSDSRALLDEGFSKAGGTGSYVFATDARAYVNGYEIPCYRGMGARQELCVTAENLRFYGFDVNYEAESQTLYIERNYEAQITPVTEEKVTPGLPLHKIYSQPGLKAVVIIDGTQYPISGVASLNGQCAISLDEFGSIFNKSWSGDRKTLEIYTN